jgi:flavorubredoxin
MNHYPSLETSEFITVKTGDILDLDGATLAFLEAP